MASQMMMITLFVTFISWILYLISPTFFLFSYLHSFVGIIQRKLLLLSVCQNINKTITFSICQGKWKEKWTENSNKELYYEKLTFSFFYFVVYIIYALLFSYIRYLKALWKRILKGHCNACTSIFTWLILAQKDFCKCSINKVETFWILINNRQEMFEKY